MDIKPGDIAIFKNGEEAVVRKITNVGQYYFKISFNKEVHGWIGDVDTSNSWDYDKKGVFCTYFPNGNDIVKVIAC